MGSNSTPHGRSGASSNKTLDPESERLLKGERVDLLYAAMPISVLATLINAFVLVVVEWQVTEHRRALLWLGLISLVTAARYLLTVIYRRSRTSRSNAGYWEKHFIAGSLIAGAVWGSSVLFLFPETSLIHQVFLAFIIGGVCAGAITTLSTSLVAIYGFIVLALFPLMIRLFIDGGEISNAMGLMLLLFMVMISASAKRIFGSTKQNIELRIKSEHQESVIRKQTLEQRAILDNAPFGIWMIDTGGRYHFVNDTFCKAIGVEEERFLSTDNLADLLGEEAAAGCLESDRLCFENEGPQISHETLTFVDGKEHLLEITKTKITDHDGRVSGAIGIAVDITDKQASEEMLRKLSQAVEQAGESIVITDKLGTIEYVNPSFTRITGYQPEDVLGNNPRILKSGKQSSEYYHRLWETISSGEVWQSSVIDRRKDGRLYPALMTISPIHDDRGEITHYVGIQQDMTDHNLLEEQFRQAQKMEALGTLVGGIAHDFNNILTGISGNIALAQFEVGEDSGLGHKLKIAEELSYKAADMIKQLMVFSRKSLIEMKPFGLTSFIDNISPLIRATVPENIAFQCELDSEELVVNGDSTQIEQVLINLLNNARDAVASVREPKISLQMDRFAADEQFIEQHPEITPRLFAHIVVSDNGSGISKTDQQHIFEPFFTTKEVGLGTGLGLSMAYGAIQSHQGVLDVESEVGEGTSFHIYIPLLEEKIVFTASESDEPVTGNGELILVVDDNADIRSTMKNILANLNYNVLEAMDGLEAVDLFIANQDRIDLVIMDVVMPRLGGVKAADRMKKIRPDIRIILTTGYDRDDAVRNEMPAEAFSIIAKPFTVAHLTRTIRKQLDA